MKIALVLAILLSACASNQDPPGGIKTGPLPADKKADPVIANSITPGPLGGSDVTGTNGSAITIRKSALGKTFLMAMSISSSAMAARPNILLPKVVSFALNGSEVGLLEENVYSIYHEIPTGKLIQSFKVLSQDADTVTFQWGYGLVSVPQGGFYVSSDDKDSVANQTGDGEKVVPATATYLKYARIVNNQLELRQMLRVRSQHVDKADDNGADEETSETTVQLDIGLSPYVKNERFAPRLSTKLKGIGLFEIAQVRKEEGAIDIYASHWDLSAEAGPITYAISKTAPAEAVNAMKEGLQYWNNVSQAALGRDIIKIETGADPDAPPRPRTVVIYWVPYANAGSAYANFQPDPITGEITSGFVYQTSVFYLSGRNRGRRFVDRGVENEPQVLPAGFRLAKICDMPAPPGLGMDPLAGGVDMDEKIGQKMGLDYLRFVVAHESGHTLGLRHNFAGSLGSEVETPAKARDLFRDYLNDEHHPGAMTSSSVMEYTTFRDVELMGAAIGAKRVFPYDKAAIAWAYGGKEVADLDPPLYCADAEGSALKTMGCATYDTGPHPVVGHAWEFARTRLLAPDVAIEALTDAVRPDNPNDQLTVKQALAKNHPDDLSVTVTAEAPNVVRLGSPGMKVLQVDREEDGPNWVNKSEYAEKTKAFVAKEFELAGGLPGFLKTAYDLDDKFRAPRGWLVDAIRAKTAKPTFGAGKTTYGKPYQLNDGEIRDVKAAAEKLGNALETAVLRDLLLAVTGLVPKDVTGGAGKGTLDAYMGYGDKLKTYDPAVAADTWQPGLDAIASQLALDADGEVTGTVDDKEVQVPAPRFPTEDRVAAMRLYSPKVFGRATPDAWEKDASDKLAAALSSRLAPIVKVDGDPAKAEPVGKLSPELAKWSKGELAVLKALWAARHP